MKAAVRSLHGRYSGKNDKGDEVKAATFLHIAGPEALEGVIRSVSFQHKKTLTPSDFYESL